MTVLRTLEKRLPSLLFERARLEMGEIVFATDGGLTKALSDGCFYLQIPDDLDITPNITLAQQFYKAVADGSPETATYRGFRECEGIYFDREHFQTEHLLADRPARLRHFPREVVDACDAMNDVAIAILRRVFRELAVPETAWHRVTGGAIDNAGTHWFASSHYRPEREQLGCAPHKDTGFVTVLYIERDGLEASIGGKWVPIDPVQGHFVVNFGASLEILTARSCRPVRAILHRVRRTEPSASGDRFSFAAFANPPASGTLYEWTDAGEILPYKSVEQFLVEFNAETWNDRHDDFGIRGP